MDGFEVLKARRAAGVSQEQLRTAMDLCGRHTLTDIESGAVEVADAFVYRAIQKISEVADKKKTQRAV